MPVGANNENQTLQHQLLATVNTDAASGNESTLTLQSEVWATVLNHLDYKSVLRLDNYYLRRPRIAGI